MLRILTAFLVGLVFGLGLILGGMTNPANVIGFLDLLGSWNPSLAFVMVGAILVGYFAFRTARTRPSAILGGPIELPQRSDITPSLVLGSMAFGVGWGLGGFCPGPGLVALGMGEEKAAIFIAAMLLGIGLHHVLTKPRST